MGRENGLYKLCAVGAVLVGLFLIAGAQGHLRAVFPLVRDADALTYSLGLLMPGSILALCGAVTLSLCAALWRGRRWAYAVAIGVAGSLLVYLLYLMTTDNPDHPFALFTAVISCHLVLLMSTRLGLVWPAVQRS